MIWIKKFSFTCFSFLPKTPIILITFLVSFSAICQHLQPGNFAIRGNINANKGTIILQMVADTMLYPLDTRNLKAKIGNRMFEFSGRIYHPLGFSIIFISDTTTEVSFRSDDMFFVEEGNQNITINIDAKEVINHNNTSQEYTHVLKPFFSKIRRERNTLDKFIDSVRTALNGKLPDEFTLQYQKALNNYYRKNDSMIYNYTKKHPNSYPIFWKLAEQCQFEYTPIYDSTYSILSSNIQQSYAGSRILSLLTKGRKSAIGLPFPEITIEPFDKINPRTLGERGTKYTLIDFWYSRCSPCIAQFPKLKTIYATYKKKGFEIIGISVDKVVDMQIWQNTIKKHELPWRQYLDVDGKEGGKLSISAFPTTFLLDANGIIIKKNIRPEELGEFLSKKL